MESTVSPLTEENQPAFYIDQILELEKPERCLKLHRPWAEAAAEKKNRGNSFCFKQHFYHQHERQLPAQQQNSSRTASNWYAGRRPRTAFTNSQVTALETVFQVNCYPGIQLREQLAGRLDLDEDRIQIWFQNHRAKLRRSLRETRLQLVQTVVTDLMVRPEVVGHLKFSLEGIEDEKFTHQLVSPLQIKVKEEEE